SALVAKDAAAALALVERAAASGLGSLRVVIGRDPADLVAELPVVPKNRLLHSKTAAVTAEGYGYDPERGELWFAGETAEAVLIELDSRRRALVDETDAFERRAAESAEAATAAELHAQEAETAFGAVAHLVARPVRDPRALAALAAQAERLDDVLAAAAVQATRVEQSVGERLKTGGAGDTGEDLRRLATSEADLRQAEAELRRAQSEAGERAAAIDVELARIDGEREEAQRRLEAADSDPADGEDRDELAAKLERDERRLEALGRVNPLAKEEYDAEKERLEELSGQREDLEQSLAELEKLRAELTETVERRFAETFETVSANFDEIASTLFPGGSGRLLLTEAGEGEEDGEPG